jgi:hypothetical protein
VKLNDQQTISSLLVIKNIFVIHLLVSTCMIQDTLPQVRLQLIQAEYHAA